MEANQSKIRENLKKMLDPGIFKVWVEPLNTEIEGRMLRIFAPNDFMAEWTKHNLLEKAREAASPVMGLPEKDIQIAVSVRQRKVIKKPVQAGQIVIDIVTKAQASQKELPLKTHFRQTINQWQFRFDDFVTGPSNNIAVAAAQDMCHSGQVRTLFVNAAPGLGKTHLAQAAGFTMSTIVNQGKIAYLTAEQFASRFVAAMRAKELEEFKQNLCELDAFLLEDVHFLQRKPAMQEMLLGVVKNLQAKGARVIFTSSFSPRQLKEMDNQLVSRFCSGILTTMQRPDTGMRCEILRRKAKTFQVKLPDDVCEVLSRRLSADVRQLESCLQSMIFKAKLMHSGLSMDLALETLGQYACEEANIDIEGIVRFVCESYGLTEQQLRSTSRKQQYVQGRNTVFYLARKHTDLSLAEIGCFFNRRHSTVLRGITQVEEEMSRESRIGRQLAKAVALIERKCGFDKNRVDM